MYTGSERTNIPCTLPGWGCLSVEGPLELYKIKQRLDTEQYKTLLEKVVLPFALKTPNTRLVHDRYTVILRMKSLLAAYLYLFIYLLIFIRDVGSLFIILLLLHSGLEPISR